MEKKALREAEADKFDILDEVKKIDIPDITQPTLSIGFSDDGKTNAEKFLETLEIPISQLTHTNAPMQTFFRIFFWSAIRIFLRFFRHKIILS